MAQRTAFAAMLVAEQKVAALEARTADSGGKFELHLSPSLELKQSLRARIRKMGGDVGDCRGYSTKRFVVLPNTEEGAELAVELLNRNTENLGFDRAGKQRRTTVVVRGFFFDCDQVVYGTAWKAEDLRRWASKMNEGGLVKARAEARRELDSAREWL